MYYWYLITDNQSPERNIKVLAIDENTALSKGASELKTCNVRILKLSK